MIREQSSMQQLWRTDQRSSSWLALRVSILWIVQQAPQHGALVGLEDRQNLYGRSSTKRARKRFEPPTTKEVRKIEQNTTSDPEAP